MKRVVISLALTLILAAILGACGEDAAAPVVIEKEVVVEKEVVRTVEIPGETIIKEVVRTVEVPGETIVIEKEVIRTVEVPGETIVVTKEVIKEVPVEVIVTKEIIREVPVEVVVIKEVIKEIPTIFEVIKEVETIVFRRYGEAPMLAELVKAGKLPPVFERLPKNPMVLPVVDEIGQYGGELFRIYTGATDVYCNASKMSGWGPWRFSIDANSLIPMVLEKWEVSTDGKVWTLSLREGMKWSDGAPVTVEDVRFAIEDWYASDLTKETVKPPRWLKGGSAGPARVEKVDDFTFKLIYDDPYRYLPRQSSGGCSGGISGMLKPAHYLKQFHMKYNPGAEKVAKDEGFTDWIDYFMNNRQRKGRNPDSPTLSPWLYLSLPGDTRYRMERNPYYYVVDPAGNQLPYIDRVTMELVTDREIIPLKVIQGDLDFQVRHMAFANFPLLKENEERGRYRTYVWPTAHYGNYMAINQTFKGTDAERALLHNYDFRRALGMAINTVRINEIVSLGTATPNRYMLPPLGHAYHPGEQYEKLPYSYDIEAGNKLLDTIIPNKDGDGFRTLPDGSRFTFLLINVAGGATHMELLQDDLAKVGIRVKFDLLERALAVNSIAANKYMAHGGYFNIDEADFLVGHWIAPGFASHTPLWAPGYSHWVMGGGEEKEVKVGGEALLLTGEKPPDDVMRILVEPFARGAGLTPDEGAKVMQEAFKWHYNNLVMLPLGSGQAALAIASSDLGNVPAVAFQTHATGGEATSWPDQFFFKR